MYEAVAVVAFFGFIALVVWSYVSGSEHCSLICSKEEEDARLELLEKETVSVWWLMSWKCPDTVWRQSAKMRNLGMFAENDDMIEITNRGRRYRELLRAKKESEGGDE